MAHSPSAPYLARGKASSFSQADQLRRGGQPPRRGVPSAANPKFATPWGNARGEFRIQSCTSKLLFLVWLLNLKFLQRACHPWDRNFKFTTLARRRRVSERRVKTGMNP